MCLFLNLKIEEKEKRERDGGEVGVGRRSGEGPD